MLTKIKTEKLCVIFKLKVFFIIINGFRRFMFIYFATTNNTVRAMIYLITNEIKIR